LHELLIILAMTVGGSLFALGGYKFKWLRRFLLPVILGGIALMAGFEVWRCIVYVVLLIGAMHLPYGEKTPWPIKALVFTAFIIPSLVFGWTYWQIASPVIILGLFKLSNTPFFANAVVHKVWEFINGCLIGIILVTINVW